MTYIDISVPLRKKMPAWPDSIGIRITRTKNLQAGDDANVTRLDLDVHIGTHIDAPNHFLRDGATVDQMSLNILMGEATVASLPDVSEISSAALQSLHLKKGICRLLLHTRNSRLWQTDSSEFQKDYVGLTLDAAHWVVENGIQLIGIDYLSIQRYGDDPETHRVLMKAGVVIIEGLNLIGVLSGEYDLFCLPVLLEGAEGAPARCVLRSRNGKDE